MTLNNLSQSLLGKEGRKMRHVLLGTRISFRAASMCAVVGPVFLLAGCASTAAVSGAASPTFERRAQGLLQAALQYPHNPVVRVEAVEALQSCGDRSVLPWIRTALLDEHAAVRFAACVAVGVLGDGLADGALRDLVSDDDDSVKVAALFARHRLGFTHDTGKMAYYLLDHPEATVRRNAALVLGLLGERGAVKVLAGAMRDPDEGVRQHALEAMARLGNREAAQELAFMANSGVGSEEVFAILALSATGDRRYVDTFRYKLATAIHLETKLAAVRALGPLGDDDGFNLAVRSLGRKRATINDPDDPPAGQVLRIRQMAAAALGAIGREDALAPLQSLMEESADPRVRVSAGGAVLRILGTRVVEPLPFMQGADPPAR